MTLAVTHAFESAKSDGADSTRIQPSNWNADHELSMATARILGRLTASSGAVEELTASQVYELLGLKTKTMLFRDTAAPTGWTKVTDQNDKALRVVSGTITTGGSVAFSTVFGQTVTGSTVLTQAQLPSASLSHSLTAASHTHGVSGSSSTQSQNHAHSGTTSGQSNSHTHSYTDRGDSAQVVAAGGALAVANDTSSSYTTGNASADHSHTFTTGTESATHFHTFSVTSAASGSLAVSGTVSLGGSGSGHTHAFDSRVQYVDIILATKD